MTKEQDLGENRRKVVAGKKGLYVIRENIAVVGGKPICVLRAEKIAMPRIDDQILRSVFYLYPTIEAAEAGEEVGGTGFQVSVVSDMHSDVAYIYGVSNAHVVGAPCYAPIIRWSFASGLPESIGMAGNREIIPRGCNQWTPHPDGDDLAVTPLGYVRGAGFGEPFQRPPRSIPSFLFMSRTVARAYDLGPGDDVYMIGRFIHHAGKYFNQPSVRSGIISLMPDNIEIETGVFQEAFLIEMRSISGHSGSPVMWKYPLSFIDWVADKGERTPAIIALLGRNITEETGEMPLGPWLLGVDCADFKYYNDVLDANNTKTGLKAKSHAGQSVVIPAWKLQELLNLEEFDIVRKATDEAIAAENRGRPVERL